MTVTSHVGSKVIHLEVGPSEAWILADDASTREPESSTFESETLFDQAMRKNRNGRRLTTKMISIAQSSVQSV